MEKSTFGLGTVTTDTFEVLDMQAYQTGVNYHFGIDMRISPGLAPSMAVLETHSSEAYQTFLSFVDASDSVEAVEEHVTENVETEATTASEPLAPTTVETDEEPVASDEEVTD